MNTAFGTQPGPAAFSGASSFNGAPAYGAVIAGRRWRGYNRSAYGAAADPYASYDVSEMPGGYSYRVWTASNNVTIIGGPRNVGETYSQSSTVGRAIMDEIRALGKARSSAVVQAGTTVVPGSSMIPASGASASSAASVNPVTAIFSSLKPLVNLIPGVQDSRVVEAQLRAARLKEAQAKGAYELLAAKQQVQTLQAQLVQAQAAQAQSQASAGPSLLPIVAVAGVLVVGAVILRSQG